MKFIKKYKISYIIGILFMFIASYIQTQFPKLLGNTIDILKIADFSKETVITNILFLLLIAAGAFASTYIWRNLVIGNSRKLECYLREQLFEHLQVLPPEFYSKRKTGDLIAYAINDISAVRMTFGPATVLSINGIALCSASIFAMAGAIDWRLTLTCLLPIPCIIFFILRIGKSIQRKFKIVQKCFASISDRIQENIYGIRVIKAYVQEEEEVRNFDKLNEAMMNANLDMVRTSSLLAPIIEICFSISFVINLIVGGNMVAAGTLSLGEFVAFNTYLVMIMAPIISIGRVITIIQRGMASLKRLDEILNIDPEIKDGLACVRTSIQGEIEIKNLSFSYPESTEKALSNISISVPKGYTIGIIGKTGSGKSTLMNLLLKLYNVEKDKIYIDGIDINDYSLNTLREGFGYVPQDHFLFSSTIKDNIKFFKDIYSQEEVEKSAALSSIGDNILSLPQGFDTLLGERGVNLSGGQKQRICIARAIIKNASILILDDSLSAVDTITESEILTNLKEFRKDKTSLIISHRVSAVKDAELILVLNKGRVCEKGTHKDLIQKGGHYYEIFRDQSEAV